MQAGQGAIAQQGARAGWAAHTAIARCWGGVGHGRRAGLAARPPPNPHPHPPSAPCVHQPRPAPPCALAGHGPGVLEAVVPRPRDGCGGRPTAGQSVGELEEQVRHARGVGGVGGVGEGWPPVRGGLGEGGGTICWHSSLACAGGGGGVRVGVRRGPTHRQSQAGWGRGMPAGADTGPLWGRLSAPFGYLRCAGCSGPGPWPLAGALLAPLRGLTAARHCRPQREPGALDAALHLPARAGVCCDNVLPGASGCAEGGWGPISDQGSTLGR